MEAQTKEARGRRGRQCASTWRQPRNNGSICARHCRPAGLETNQVWARSGRAYGTGHGFLRWFNSRDRASLDLALEGDGFLVVQTARGQRYTRQGSLTLDNAGPTLHRARRPGYWNEWANHRASRRSNVRRRRHDHSQRTIGRAASSWSLCRCQRRAYKGR